MRHFAFHAITLALLSLSAGAQAQQSTEIGKITVTGEGDKLGTGLIVDEDTPKAKSTVTKAQLDKLRSSANPFQAMALMPGVNSSSYDATGLFGGNLRVRGFNSDQMGFTVNGAPVNDSGNFAVYPQEYTDMETICEISLTQGATDNEAPHVGASGGNVGINSCGVEDKQRVRVAISGGSLKYQRGFFRVDTGKVGDFKGFMSISNSKVDKWKGEGHADRTHVDAGAEYKLGDLSFNGSLLYNRAVNNNFRTLTLAQLDTLGYNADYATNPPQHLNPVKGLAQNESSIASGTAYYGYALNPFRNYLITAGAHAQLSPATRLDVEPYFWYGYGTGGVQQTSIAESSGSTKLGGGVADINGDGDTLDTILVYRGSVTETNRPGVTIKLSHAVDNHQLLGGVWYEQARHRQTQPATRVDSAGHISSLWLNSALITHADGTLYQGRNWLTKSTGQSVFLQDTIDLLDSKLRIIPGLSYRSLNRDFTNYANDGSGGGADYQVSRNYAEFLPSLNTSYQLGEQVQLFAGIAKNMRTPSNFELGNAVTSVTYTNGVATASTVQVRNTVKQETAINLDTGVRVKNEFGKGSITAFFTQFKNRIGAGYDPIQAGRFDINVGDSKMRGLELEAGTVPFMGFSAYASATYTRSTLNDDLLYSYTASGKVVPYTAPTSGKQYPDTPKYMAASALQWSEGPYLVNLSAKFTGRRFTTLTNDQSIPGFTTVDLSTAYKLPNTEFTKNSSIRVNVSNLLNKKYLLANSGSGSSFTVNATGAGASSPSLYQGAPRFFSVSAQTDF